MLEETHKLKGYRPLIEYMNLRFTLEETFKLK